jgi:hypothetical protein
MKPRPALIPNPSRTAFDRFSRPRRQRTRGVSMPEVLMALCVMSFGFLALWTSAGQCLQMARSHRETIAATETLLRRVEDCRAAGWNTIVSASSIRDNILGMTTNSAALAEIEEQITVTPYPPVTPAPTAIVVQRHANGTVEIVSQPADGLYLRSLLAVRVDFQATWKSGSNHRSRRRETSTVISAQALLR